MHSPIKIIDLFAGPGGLGEGFSSFKNKKGYHPFKIAISIEKEGSAHRTLKLRSFFRQFSDDNKPVEYYSFLKGEFGNYPEDRLYRLPKYANELKQACSEAQQLELGKDNEMITEKINNALGDKDCILIGGPPCQAYSLAGRARNKGIKDYRAEKDHRNFLFKEYLKIIALFQPTIFVMENVKGMLSAKVDGVSIYETIFNDLHDPCKAVNTEPRRNKSKHKYKIFSLVTPVDDNKKIKPNDFVIKSENFGIPQRRHRVILLGIREDHTHKWNNKFILNKQENISVVDVINDLPKLRSGLSKEQNNDNNWLKTIKSQAKNTIKALKKTSKNDIAKEFENIMTVLQAPKQRQGYNFGLKHNQSMSKANLENWYYDKKLGQNICNHETRGHISSDLQRYLFCSIWAKVAYSKGCDSLSPKSKDYPVELMPNHKNFQSGKFSDRFRVQPWNIPATTITCHISKDGHYFIHPDPLQCRSFTVREAARIQTFPDNYFFVGTRTQQYVQVGNAVPPLLAHSIAEIIYKIL
ncbi:MAG: DNA cytosine methyltransferase [gamma proteobacterium symbiont of Taylorina sp.]|nr:DNA cytosine methyltransferase [gamma proteobacterium symbiont of Taylorina sp.]